MRKLIQTKAHGPKKKMIASSLTSEPMVKVAGAHYLKLLAFFAVGKVVDFAGSTT